MKHSITTAILVGCSDGLLSRLRLEFEDVDMRIEAELPDVRAAIERLLLSLNDTRLFVVHVKSSDDLPAMKRLADAFDGHPILALVEEGDPSLFVAANRHGAAQVVPLPLQREDFRAALKRVGQQFGGPRGKNEVIAVAGVTGGCGATAIASNLAYEIAQTRDGHCILVELALQIGKLANYFDVEPELTTQDLIKAIDRLEPAMIEQALARIDENFSILSGPYRTLTPISVAAEDVRRLVHYTRALTNLVILDVPCTLDEHYFEVLSSADRVVLVCEQKIPSLRSLKLVCDALDRRGPVKPRILVINRYNPTLPGLSVKKLEDVLKTKGFQTISNDFAAMNATLDHGRPLRMEAPKSRALADINQLARVLFPEVGPTTRNAARKPFLSFSRRGRKKAAR